MEGGEFRCWAELLPDALGLIFSNLCLRETLTVIPRVCTSWRVAVLGPYCWQKIDIEEWSYQSDSETIDRMLRMLVSRSGGALREISVCGLQNDISFAFVADHARALKTLQLPRSNMTDSMVELVAYKLSTITFLDLSYCCRIGARSLEAIGKTCKSLSGLCRNMHPSESDARVLRDDEALAIASFMPNLNHLELAYLRLTTPSVVEILQKCPRLRLLDLRGCWEVRVDEMWVYNNFPGVMVLGPDVVDHQLERAVWCDFCSDYSGSDLDSFYDDYEESFEGIWYDDEATTGNLELRFYEGFGDGSIDGWPSSP